MTIYWNIVFDPSPLHCHSDKCVQMRFWFVFSRIRTEYGEMLRISPYSVRMRENTNQKKLRIWTHFTQCVGNGWKWLVMIKFTSN